MKKILTMSIVVMMGIATFLGQQAFHSQYNSTSDLLLENAEALADDDEPAANKKCYGGNFECIRVHTAPGTVHIFYQENPPV